MGKELLRRLFWVGRAPSFASGHEWVAHSHLPSTSRGKVRAQPLLLAWTLQIAKGNWRRMEGQAGSMGLEVRHGCQSVDAIHYIAPARGRGM